MGIKTIHGAFPVRDPQLSETSLELLPPPIFFSSTSRWVLETFLLPPASRPSTTFWPRGPTWRDSSPHRSMWPSLRPWAERLPGQMVQSDQVLLRRREQEVPWCEGRLQVHGCRRSR